MALMRKLGDLGKWRKIDRFSASGPYCTHVTSRMRLMVGAAKPPKLVNCLQHLMPSFCGSDDILWLGPPREWRGLLIVDLNATKLTVHL